MIHITGANNGAALFEALNSDIRIKILNILKTDSEVNISQLAKMLNITNGAMTAHIKKLQDAALINVSSVSGIRGSQKVCRLSTTKIIIDLFDENVYPKNVYSFDIGIGLYSDYKISPTCGLVNSTAIIGELDETKYFSFPERADASLLWFSHGYITYQLPNSLKTGEVCTEIQIGLELASEAPGYTTHYPSDISFRINGHDLGYFTSPGEFNDRKGIFTPEWWFENLGQYGKLKLLTVNASGCFIDGLKVSPTTITDLEINNQSDITFTVEVSPDAVNRGGVTLFGKGFGDYDNGITMKMFYEVINEKNT